MAKYKHGIYVDEVPTKMPVPQYATSGIQVVFGTAPINKASDPYGVTNKPLLITSMDDAEDQLGYSEDFEAYTLCQSMYASFGVSRVAPVVMINVLDPTRHTQEIAETELAIKNRIATLDMQGVLLDKLVVKNGDADLTAGTDYAATLNDDGTVSIGLTSGGAAAEATTIKVSGTALDPTKVEVSDIVGGTDGGGKRSGIACIRDVYPTCQVIPATMLAPGWSENAEVGAALISHAREINGVFRSFVCLDLDSKTTTKSADVPDLKEKNGYSSSDCAVLWPEVKIGSDNKRVRYSAAFAAGMQALDADNGDCPTRTPSNVDMGITACVLYDGTEINMDLEQANELNAAGIVTACRAQGWKTWGVETGAYPGTIDVKDRFIGVRRMFSWQMNSFITRYLERLDQNISNRAIEALVTDENVRCNALAAQDKWAGGRIEYRQEENPLTDVLAGKVKFDQYITPYPPMKEIHNTLEYNADILAANLAGGEE